MEDIEQPKLNRSRLFDTVGTADSQDKAFFRRFDDQELPAGSSLEISNESGQALFSIQRIPDGNPKENKTRRAFILTPCGQNPLLFVDQFDCRHEDITAIPSGLGILLNGENKICLSDICSEDEGDDLDLVGNLTFRIEKLASSPSEFNAHLSGRDFESGYESLDWGTCYGVTKGVCGSGSKTDNQDCFGVCMDGTLVVADGISSGFNPQIAASLVTQTVTENEGNLPEKVAKAYEKVCDLNHHILKSGRRSNTTMAAAKIKDGKLETCVVGDSLWCLIRNGQIIAQSRIYSHKYSSCEYYMNGSERHKKDFLESVNKDQSYVRDSSVYNSFLPDGFYPDAGYFYLDENGEWTESEESLTLQEGDRLVLMTDGAEALSHEEIIESVSNASTDQDACQSLMQRISSKNERDPLTGEVVFYPKQFDDGTVLRVRPPCDNATVVVATYNPRFVRGLVDEVLAT